MRTPDTETIRAEDWDADEYVVLQRRWSFLEGQENAVTIAAIQDERLAYLDAETGKLKDPATIREVALLTGRLAMVHIVEGRIRVKDPKTKAWVLTAVDGPEVFLHMDQDAMAYILQQVQQRPNAVARAQAESAAAQEAAGQEAAEGGAGFHVVQTGRAQLPRKERRRDHRVG